MARRHRKLRISLVGAGSVGTTLAVALHRQGHSVVSVVSRHLGSARQCAKLVGCRNYSTEISSLPKHQDLILIAVPEDAVKVVTLQLWRSNLDLEGVYVGHTSGVLSSDILRPAESRGARVFSLHPIQTFSRNSSLDNRVTSLTGISYGFEGLDTTHSFVKNLVRVLGGHLVFIPKEAKILYHLSCVFASNYPVVLMSVVEGLSSQFLKRPTLRHFERLVQTSIANAFTVSPKKALTGPIARGSLKTVRLHLTELKRKRKDLLSLYRELGTLTLDLAGKKLTPKTMKGLRRILSKTRRKLGLRETL